MQKKELWRRWKEGESPSGAEAALRCRSTAPLRCALFGFFTLRAAEAALRCRSTAPLRCTLAPWFVPLGGWPLDYGASGVLS